MTPPIRRLVGTVVLIAFLAVYAVIALLAAVALQPNAGRWTEIAYYVVAGLAWVPPAAWIVSWMYRQPASPAA